MNPFIANFRLRTVIAVALISCAFVFAAFAITKDQQAGADKCWAAWEDCAAKICTAGRASHSEGWYSRCTDYCYGRYVKCMDHYGLQAGIPNGTPPPRIGGLPPNPTPTPRKGPGNISGLPVSNPTPTPRKGPGKTGTTGIGRSSPTPSPTGPVLLEKSGKPSPTPKPTPKKVTIKH
jgi:hypothetical protein